MSKKLNENDKRETEMFRDALFAEFERKGIPLDLQIGGLALTLIDICIPTHTRQDFQKLIFAMYDKFIEE